MSKENKKSGLLFLIFEILDLIFLDNELEPDEKSEKHTSHPDIVNHEGYNMIIFEEIHHREEIAPVVCLLAHATDEWEGSSARIGDIECDISHILTCPPECEECTERARLFLSEEYKNEREGKEALKKAPAKYSHEFSKRHEKYMSCLMEYEIRSMDKSIHHLLIHIEREKLERVEE